MQFAFILVVYFYIAISVLYLPSSQPSGSGVARGEGVRGWLLQSLMVLSSSGHSPPPPPTLPHTPPPPGPAGRHPEVIICPRDIDDKRDDRRYDRGGRAGRLASRGGGALLKWTDSHKLGGFAPGGSDWKHL